MNKVAVGVISAVLGGAVGAFVSYKITKQRLTVRHELEIEEVKANYRPTFRTEDGRLLFPSGIGPDLSAEENYIKAQDIVRNYELVNEVGYADTPDDDGIPDDGLAARYAAGADVTDDQPERDVPSGRIWDNRIELGSYEKREGEPYLISRREFEEPEPEFETGSLTWYMEDETLADDMTDNGAAEIENVGFVIGERHLEMFGMWSDDPNVFYVKNEDISTKYSVSRSEGSYENIVLGLEPGSV